MGAPRFPPGLAPTVELVRLRALAAFFARLNAGAGFADPRIPTAIHLREPSLSARLDRVAARPSKTHARQAAELTEAIAAAGAVPDGPRLAALISRLALDPVAAALVRVVLAYAVDADVRELVHVLASRRRPALYLDVCAELDPALDDVAGLVAATSVRAPLCDGGLIAVTGDGIGGELAATRRLVDWITGDDRLPAPLDEVATVADDLPVWLGATLRARLDAIGARLVAATAPVAVLIQGPRGSGRRAAAAALATALDRPLLSADLTDLLALEDKARSGHLVRAFLTEARLHDAVAYLSGAEALAGERDVERGAIAALQRGPSPLIVAAGGRGVTSLPLGRPFHLIRMPRVDLDERVRAWSESLATVGASLADDEAAELAGRYVIGPGAIAEVAREAREFAGARGGSVDRVVLEEAVSRRLSIRLGAFGTVISRKARFEEMVLHEEVVESLHDMIAMVRKRSQILESWGYQRHLGISRGVSALFSGEPGTGKTMAASVVASELGLEMIRIDLAQVVSKWVGETEKNLAKIFDEAQDANALLLFDEADALFGKRTEVKSAQDRYANLEVNYILQRMESFDGVSVLTTNFESSIDQALQRRLNFRIRFPEPEVAERELLWQKLLPPGTGLHGSAPFASLAERFEMTGGYIKNAIVRAAVIAARDGRELTSDDLWTGAHNEYAEMGKVLSSLTRT